MINKTALKLNSSNSGYHESHAALCVCARVRACVGARVCARVWVGACARSCVAHLRITVFLI